MATCDGADSACGGWNRCRRGAQGVGAGGVVRGGHAQNKPRTQALTTNVEGGGPTMEPAVVVVVLGCPPIVLLIVIV